MSRVQIEIKLQDVYRYFPEKTELAAFRVLRDQLLHICFVHLTLAGNARNLEFRCRRRYVRIESRAGGGYQVHRDWRRRILRVECCTELLTRSVSILLVGPRFDPPLAVGS
jgi:hypothetical protein